MESAGRYRHKEGSGDKARAQSPAEQPTAWTSTGATGAAPIHHWRCTVHLRGHHRIGPRRERVSDRHRLVGVWDQRLVLKNLTTGAVPLEMWSGNNVLNIGCGAYVTGTLTVSGALAHTAGSTLGFYGATPVSRPSVTGCRSDGTALQSLLQALQSQGLIVNNTTP